MCCRGSQLLYVRRAKSKWNLPGGTPKRGEALKAAAFRELEEETGRRPAEMLFIARFESRAIEHYVYLADLENDYFAPAPLGEIAACRWMTTNHRALDLTAQSSRVLKAFAADVKSLRTRS